MKRQSRATVWTKLGDDVTYGEVLDTTNALCGNPRSDDVAQAFRGFPGIGGFVVDESEVKEIAYVDHAASRHLRPMKAAFIMRDPGQLVMADPYIAPMRELGSPRQSRTFPCREEARAWMASGR